MGFFVLRLFADHVHRVAPEEFAADFNARILVLVNNRIKDFLAGALFFMLFFKRAIDDFLNG